MKKKDVSVQRIIAGRGRWRMREDGGRGKVEVGDGGRGKMEDDGR